MVQGVIFDFNGTLYWDSALHEEAWRTFIQQLTGRILTETDMKNQVHGRINRDILHYALDRELTTAEVHEFSDTKENIYRQLVQNSPSHQNLAPGAVELLEYLKDLKIPFTIATSAERSNVDFYFEFLNLGRWFDFPRLIYDDGTIIPKPAPDIFLKAASKLEVPAAKCLVLEDSITGIQSAHRAGAYKILFVENDVPVEYDKVKNLVSGRIRNLMEAKEYL